MIAHVAEANENSGRVVLHLAAQAPIAPAALGAALHIARCFNAGLESLVTEDPQLIDFASFSFAHEITAAGQKIDPLRGQAFESALQDLTLDRHREVALAAAASGVPLHCRTLRDETAQALAAACIENGPWNVAVLGEPVSEQTEANVANLFDTIDDVTGFVVAGVGAAHRPGAVVAIVEDIGHVQPMLRAAERLAAGDDVHLILFGGNRDEMAWLEAQVRLLLGGNEAPDLILAPETFASADALASVVHGLHANFVIAQFGGALLAFDGGLEAFARHHDGPLFLVRS